MKDSEISLKHDIAHIEQISIVPYLLDVICKTTKMGFAAIARVTEDRWITCSVKDDIFFGLKPGDELQIKTTICNEVRQHHQPVVIDHVEKDPNFYNHHTPAMYGFQSYISVPIIRKDGSFFGTLCAIDPNPHELNSPEVLNMFTLFADLISFHLQAIDQINASKSTLLEERAEHKKDKEHQMIFIDELEQKVQERTKQLSEKNMALEKMNIELESFAFLSSHDLQEPLRKIQTYANLIADNESANLSEAGKNYFVRMLRAAQHMRTLITDLLAYSHTDMNEKRFEQTNLVQLIDEIKEELNEDLQKKQAVIETVNVGHVNVIPGQFRQIFHNMITNSLKFSQPGGKPYIVIEYTKGQGSDFENSSLLDSITYDHLRISDNGIGFDQQYSDQIFKLFRKLHRAADYPGTGLGLAIVKRIVESHRGIISAKGVENTGATFDIYIPAN